MKRWQVTYIGPDGSIAVENELEWKEVVRKFGLLATEFVSKIVIEEVRQNATS